MVDCGLGGKKRRLGKQRCLLARKRESPMFCTGSTTPPAVRRPRAAGLVWSGLVLQPNPTSCPSFLTRCWSWPLPTSRPPARPPRDHFRDDNDNRQIQTMPKQQKTEVWPLQSSSPLQGGHLHYYLTSRLKKAQHKKATNKNNKNKTAQNKRLKKPLVKKSAKQSDQPDLLRHCFVKSAIILLSKCRKKDNCF